MSGLYVCKEYENMFFEGFKALRSFEEHKDIIRENTVDEMVATCKNYEPYKEGFEYGKKLMFDIFSEHCRNGHLIIGFDDQGDFRGCFPRETGKFDREQWMCSYENCPLIKKQ